jgi:hypothetical protein
MFWNFLQPWRSHIHFYISLHSIIGKLLRKATTLFLKTCQSKFIWKSWIRFEHICSPRQLRPLFLKGTRLFPKQFKTFLPKRHSCFLGQFRSLFLGRHEKFLRINMCLGEQGLRLPCETTMFFKELGPKFLGEQMPWICVWS